MLRRRAPGLRGGRVVIQVRPQRRPGQGFDRRGRRFDVQRLQPFQRRRAVEVQRRARRRQIGQSHRAGRPLAALARRHQIDGRTGKQSLEAALAVQFRQDAVGPDARQAVLQCAEHVHFLAGGEQRRQILAGRRQAEQVGHDGQIRGQRLRGRVRGCARRRGRRLATQGHDPVGQFFPIPPRRLQGPHLDAEHRHDGIRGLPAQQIRRRDVDAIEIDRRHHRGRRPLAIRQAGVALRAAQLEHRHARRPQAQQQRRMARPLPAPPGARRRRGTRAPAAFRFLAEAEGHQFAPPLPGPFSRPR